jgi:hypothetical protein
MSSEKTCVLVTENYIKTENGVDSYDYIKVEVDQYFIDNCQTLKNMIDDCSEDSFEFPISFEKRILDIVVDFFNMKKTLTEEDDHTNKDFTVVQEKEFMEKIDRGDYEKFVAIIMFLDATYLQEVCAKQLAKHSESIKDLSVLREWLGVADDWENEEERQKAVDLCRWMYPDY